MQKHIDEYVSLIQAAQTGKEAYDTHYPDGPDSNCVPEVEEMTTLFNLLAEISAPVDEIITELVKSQGNFAKKEAELSAAQVATAELNAKKSAADQELTALKAKATGLEGTLGAETAKGAALQVTLDEKVAEIKQLVADKGELTTQLATAEAASAALQSQVEQLTVTVGEQAAKVQKAAARGVTANAVRPSKFAKPSASAQSPNTNTQGPETPDPNGSTGGPGSGGSRKYRIRKNKYSRRG